MTEVLEGQLVLPEKVALGQIIISNGLIEKIVLDEDAFTEPTRRLPSDELISPGFVDIQINGAFGKEFKTDTDAVDVVRNQITRFGTTSFCPTVTTIPIATYPKHLDELTQNVSNRPGAKVVGFHLEGPYLNPTKAGAQNADLLEVPADCPYEDYVDDRVAIVTLSPELEGSEALIDRLRSDGIKVGVGHSLIDYDSLVRLFVPEDMIIVHVFNAMADLNSRKPGVIGAAMDRDEYYCSVIADGIHVSPATVRIFWKSKTDKRKVICITDGSAVAGLDVGIHNIGSRSIEKREDRAVLEGTETLVGSILTLNVAAKNIQTFTGCSLSDAISCVSLNPATYLGKENEIGQIREGNAADLVILNDGFEVQRTIVDGEAVWSRE